MIVGATALAVLSLLLAQDRPARTQPTPTLLAVPLISQAQSWTCGGAALMAALVYFGKFDEPEARLDADLGATPERGTLVSSMVAEARRFGLDAEARTGLDLADLEAELQQQTAVIVAIQAWASEPVANWRTHWEDGHYVVVVGISAERVYVMDPSVRTGYAYLDRADFLDRWHDYDVENGRRVTYDRLGIVIRGDHPLARYPAAPVPIQ
jgi:ABC-type bacteriocin/lantibiotic exporter with double-glycine peptidase domain